MNGKSRTSSENMGGAMLDVVSNIMAVQILPTLLEFPECTLKLSELKSLILEQLSSNPKTMQQIMKYQSSCIVDPENPGMLHFPSRTSLDMLNVPRWPTLKDAVIGPRLIENGLENELTEDIVAQAYQRTQRSLRDVP